MIEDKRVEQIFIELQKKGLIDRKRKLKVARCRNLQAAKLTNSIKYNLEFTKSLSENSIRFALLHEEGHKREKQIWVPAAMFFFSLISISIFLIYISGADCYLKWGVHLLILLVAVLFPNIFKKKLDLDEYRADAYASKGLYNEYKQSPSEIFKNFLKESYRDERVSYALLLKYAILAYHPFEFERLTKIKIQEELMKDGTK